ncbi:unnamed protein product [Cochlearia groenlandica]
MAGELQETAPCKAITEKRPNRLSGCVGVFLQLFDWNRRFSKKKLFSRKSLLTGKQSSKRFGGNDKLLKSKLNMIDDENRGRSSEVAEFRKHEMRSPSLVARLMGLESIPSNHKKIKTKKKPSLFSEIQDKNDYCNVTHEDEEEEEDEEEDNGFDKFTRPRKMQRTKDVCDRRRVLANKFGSDALQIKNVLTRVKKHHHNHYNNNHQTRKLASPVRSPRLHRRNSRLIDAAARILEPGRRNSKYAIAYPSSLGTRIRENAGKEPYEVVVLPDSCKACGSLVDVNGKNTACVSESTPFERSKRNVFWRNQEPSASVSGKGRDCLDQMQRKALHRSPYEFNGKHVKDEMVLPCVRSRSGFHSNVLQREMFPPKALSFPLESARDCCFTPANAINSKDKDFIAFNRGSTSKNLNATAKYHSRFEESSSRPGLCTSARKRRLACVSGHGRGSGVTSIESRRSDGECSCACSNEPAFSPLKLGSPRRNHSQRCRESKDRKVVQCAPNQMGERNSRTPFPKRLSPVDAAGTLGLIQQKLKEIASQEEDETIRGSGLPTKSASLILHELLSSLALEQQTYAETSCRRKGKAEMWSSIGNTNGDYTSPGSVLDASFSNESCFSNSFDNVSVPGQTRVPLEPVQPDWEVLEDLASSFKNSTSGGNYRAIAGLVSHVSNVLRCLGNTGLILTQQRFTAAREVIINTELLVGTTKQENYLIGPELFDELMIYAARSDNLVNLPGITGGFLVDAMIEHLEERNISCGVKLSSAETDELIKDVLEKVPKWGKLARVSMDEVIGIEMEKWMDLETHLLGLGSEIAYEILWCLVGEVATDLL